MRAMHKAIMLEGYKDGLAGKPRDANPHGTHTGTHDVWEEGYDYAVPDKDSGIAVVFAPAFGGPPRRDREYGPKDDLGCRQSTGKFEDFPLPFYKPENYIGDDVNYDWNTGEKKVTKDVPDEWNRVFQERLVTGGVYDVTDIAYCHIEDAETLDHAIGQDGLDFVRQHGAENIYIANGYQVQGIFLFAGKPRDYEGALGDFGRGACTLFTNCPKTLLIVAEDD